MSEASPSTGNQVHESSDEAVAGDLSKENQAARPPLGPGVDEQREDTEASGGNDDDEESEESEDGEDVDDGEEDDDEEEDEEPKLKYARLTQHLGAVYRNGDATSSFLIAGDKMVR